MSNGKFKFSKRLRFLLTSVLRVAVVVIYLLPILWVVLTSIKPPILTVTTKIVLFFKPTLENYFELFSKYDFGYYIVNSLVIALCSTFITIVISAMAAYSLSRHNIWRRNDIAFWILSIRMLPPVASILPVFILMRTLGLLDTRFSMILMYSIFNIPLAVWVIRAYMAKLPKEIDEAALVDGCSLFRTFLHIEVPLSKPGIMAAATLTFILAWNEFMFALVLAGVNAKTFPVAIAGFQAKHGLFLGQLAAGAILGTLPVLIMSILLGRHVVAGLVVGAVNK